MKNPPRKGREDMMFSRGLCISAALFALLASPAAIGDDSIELILDASGSMNARLPSGGTRIEAAKSAVRDFIGHLAPETRLAYRVYGHQSSVKAHNCQDTELLVGFGSVVKNRNLVLASTESVEAQGYTPITYVIQLAAADVVKEPGRRMIVLVSDGKETCKGDPCAAAKALAEADAKLVIHTIGFNVDAAARYQLRCIANVGRGSYRDATGAGELASRLSELAQWKSPETKVQVTIAKPLPGKLQMKPIFDVHAVYNAATGKKVGALTGSGPIIELPPGIYSVAFGKRLWQSIEVRAGELTVIEPGALTIENASPRGHRVLDAETGEELAHYFPSRPFIELTPSTFTITFGKAVWPNVQIEPGEHKVLKPGVIEVKGMGPTELRLRDEGGEVVETIVSSSPQASMPPGKYTLEVGRQKVPVDLGQGQRFEVNLE
jgi:hypothetical protein